MIRLARTTIGFACLISLLPFAGGEAAENEPANENANVRMPIEYDGTMIVIVSKKGAAGVRFLDPFAKGNKTGNGVVGTSYEWRYLERQPNAQETTGKGRVFAKLADGKVQHGSSTISCEPIQVSWNSSDSRTCTIQYDATELAVFTVAPEFFADRKDPNIPTKAVDLTRFLYVDEEANEEHRQEVYDGPDTKTRRYRQDVGGRIIYGNCVIVARDPHGVATFKFGKTFTRKPEADEVLDGIGYEFTFRSHDGKVFQEGKDEVYERTKNGKYDHGRLNVEAGSIHFQWSRGGDGSGWVYYDPTWIRVSYGDLDHAKNLLRAIANADPTPNADSVK